jgi:hypothetical protein
MRSAAVVILISAIGSLVIAGAARADEQIVPLAESGDWTAVAHHVSMTAPPDVCMAMTEQGLLFRADADGVALRMVNKKWSLPTDVHGSISVSVGTWKQTFEITFNTSNMVSSDVQEEDVAPMFAAMDKAGSMSVTVGSAAPTTISLAGSTRVTDAFRTCAGIKSNSKTPGSNPFE